MFRILLALTLAMICSAVASAQDQNAECPKITVIGPAGLPVSGKLVSFDVKVRPAVSELVYKWSVSSGSVESGQGTKSIGVKYDLNGGGLTATVEIGGLPQNCPAIASEKAAWSDPTPQAIKIDTYSPPISSMKDERLRSIIDAIKNNPTSQIYILVSGVKELRDALFERLKKVVNPLVDPSYITVVDTAPENKLIEVWLVPPGAMPPSKCDECESVKPCPIISIVGPAGIVRPGEIATYTATVSGPTLIGLGYDWEVSIGNVVDGMGKPTIKVQMPVDQTDVTAVVTVTVKGLPESCANRFSEAAVVLHGGDPVAIDEYGRLSRNDEKARLAYASDQLAKNPDLIAFVLLRTPKKSGRIANNTYNKRVETITALFRSLRVNKDIYFFVDAGDGELSTTIYLMPPSAVPDSWKTGKKQ